MAHKGKNYELCFRRDYRMQQFDNSVGFPQQQRWTCTDMAGPFGLYFNAHPQICDYLGIAPLSDELYWRSPLITDTPFDCWIEIRCGIAVGQTNYGNWHCHVIGLGDITQAGTVAITPVLPSAGWLGGPYNFLQPSLWHGGFNPVSGFGPKFYH